MRTIMRNVVVASLLLTNLSGSQQASAQNYSVPNEAKIQAWVQDFYNWYLANARNEHVDALRLALKDRRSAFSEQLVKGLEDVDAVAERDKDPGLDFDPVLDSQDPGDPGDPPYLVGTVRHHGDTYRVDVYLKSTNEKTELAVVPELKIVDGSPVFVNFHYPNSTDPRNENLGILIRNYLKPPGN